MHPEIYIDYAIRLLEAAKKAKRKKTKLKTSKSKKRVFEGFVGTVIDKVKKVIKTIVEKIKALWSKIIGRDKTEKLMKTVEEDFQKDMPQYREVEAENVKNLQEEIKEIFLLGKKKIEKCLKDEKCEGDKNKMKEALKMANSLIEKLNLEEKRELYESVFGKISTTIKSKIPAIKKQTIRFVKLVVLFFFVYLTAYLTTYALLTVDESGFKGLLAEVKEFIKQFKIREAFSFLFEGIKNGAVVALIVQLMSMAYITILRVLEKFEKEEKSEEVTTA